MYQEKLEPLSQEELERLDQAYEDSKQDIDQALEKAMSPLSHRFGFIRIDLHTGKFIRFQGGRANGDFEFGDSPPTPPQPHIPQNGELAGSWNFEASPGCAWRLHDNRWWWVCT